MRNLMLLLWLPALAPVAQASVIVDAYYTWSGVVGDPAAASVGGLTGAGTITLVDGPAGPPGVSFYNGAYYSGGVVSTATDNFGIDAWVMAADTTSQGAVANNGNFYSSGWGLYQYRDRWMGWQGGSGYRIGTVTPGIWVQIAMVRSGGSTCYYLDGTLQGSACQPNPPTAPSGEMVIGGDPVAGWYFTGGIAAVRVFEFAPGGFSPATDLSDMPVPEPASFGLAAGALGLLAWWRRRG